MNKQYKLLKHKLDNFITRYRIYKLLYSLILFIILISVLFSLAVLVENNFTLKNYIRGIIFYFFLVITGYLSIELVFIPIYLIFKKRKNKDYYKAAEILEKNIDKIDDKLINVIELAQNKKPQNNYSLNLLNASINQKSFELRRFKIKEAISFKKIINRIGIIIILFVITGITYTKNNKVINNAAIHYIKYETELINKEKNVKVVVLNKDLNVEEGGNFKLNILINTKKIFKEPVISYYGNKFYLHNDSTNYFSYIFYSVNNSFDFKISVNNYTSDKYTINVLTIPIIVEFNINITPPKYTGLKTDHLKNIGDISVAEGSTVKWKFNVENTDTLSLNFKNVKRKSQVIISNNKGVYKNKFVNNVNYSVSLINGNIKKENILNYSITVIKDKYPSIEVNEIKDSNNYYGRGFYGFIQDDYGFDSLFFTLSNIKENEKERIAIPINNTNNQEFYFQYDFNNINEDADVEYYFEVWDNDRINGSKKTVSKIKSIEKLNNKEKEKLSDEKFNNIEKSIISAISLSNEINNELEKIKENLTNSNMSDFEKDRAIKSIVQKKEELEQIINNVRKEYKEKSVLDKLGNKEKEELAKRQKEISDLLENLLTDEIKKLIEELQKLKNEQANDKKLKDISEKMEFNFKDLSKQIDNSLELLKKMEIERKIEKSIEDLKKLAEDLKKENLNSKTGEKNSEIIKNKKEEFNTLMNDYKKALELNRELKNKLPLKQFPDDSNKIIKNFEETIKKIEQKQVKKANKINQENSKQIRELSEKMNEMLNKMQAEAIEIDIELLKSIIYNVTQFSFDQEKLMLYGKTININNPLYLKTYTDQQNIAKEYKFIKKQLDTLTERTTAINHIIKKDIISIEQNLIETNDYFENKQKSKIAVKQQFIMTSANNLLLKLDEVLKSLLENSQPGKSGDSKNCKKPSKPSTGLGDLKKQQENFKNQLQDMIKQMKESNKGKPKNSELAKMLAEQEMYKQLLNELSNSNNIGNKTSKELKDIKKLIDENISDIIKSRLDNNMLLRQDLIKTRLLKAEQSEREREIENKRISKENLIEKRSNPISNFEYKKENYNFNELLKKKNVKFNEFYRNKTKKYFKTISE